MYTKSRISAGSDRFIFALAINLNLWTFTADSTVEPSVFFALDSSGSSQNLYFAQGLTCFPSGGGPPSSYTASLFCDTFDIFRFVLLSGNGLFETALVASANEVPAMPLVILATDLLLQVPPAGGFLPVVWLVRENLVFRVQFSGNLATLSERACKNI